MEARECREGGGEGGRGSGLRDPGLPLPARRSSLLDEEGKEVGWKVCWKGSSLNRSRLGGEGKEGGRLGEV